MPFFDMKNAIFLTSSWTMTKPFTGRNNLTKVVQIHNKVCGDSTHTFEKIDFDEKN